MAWELGRIGGKWMPWWWLEKLATVSHQTKHSFFFFLKMMTQRMGHMRWDTSKRLIVEQEQCWIWLKESGKKRPFSDSRWQLLEVTTYLCFCSRASDWTQHGSILILKRGSLWNTPWSQEIIKSKAQCSKQRSKPLNKRNNPKLLISVFWCCFLSFKMMGK